MDSLNERLDGSVKPTLKQLESWKDQLQEASLFGEYSDSVIESCKRDWFKQDSIHSNFRAAAECLQSRIEPKRVGPANNGNDEQTRNSPGEMQAKDSGSVKLRPEQEIDALHFNTPLDDWLSSREKQR